VIVNLKSDAVNTTVQPERGGVLSTADTFAAMRVLSSVIAFTKISIRSARPIPMEREREEYNLAGVVEVVHPTEVTPSVFTARTRKR